jgi:hypothetical protein
VVLEFDSQDIYHEHYFAMAVERMLAKFVFVELIKANLNCFIVIKELLKEGVKTYFL